MSFPTDLTPWFQRQFPFTQIAHSLPGLRERLSGTPLRLQHLVQHYAPGHWYAAQPGGSWTFEQHVIHLRDIEQLWQRRIHDFLADATTLTPTDLTNAIVGNGTYPQHQLPLHVQAFTEARAHTLTLIATLTDAQWQKQLRHPRLDATLSLGDHLYFVAEHDDHHLSVMRAL